MGLVKDSNNPKANGNRRQKPMGITVFTLSLANARNFINNQTQRCVFFFVRLISKEKLQKMACKTILRSVFVSESRRTSGARRCFFLPPSPASVPVHGLFPAPKSLCFNGFASVPERATRLNCSHNDQSDQGPPQEAVLKAISGARLR